MFTSSVAAGTAVADEPAEVSGVLELMQISEDLDGDYVLVADVDFSEVEEFEPLGESAGRLEESDGFRGSFDGRGHSITNLTVEAERAGLFAALEHGAEVSNVTFESPDVKGEVGGGAVASTMFDGSITDVTIHDAVVEAGSAGALVARHMGGEISEVQVKDVEVSGKTWTGGVLGCSGVCFLGEARNPRTADVRAEDVQVDGDRFTGGFVGRFDGGVISRSSVDGSVKGEEFVGGFAGLLDGTSEEEAVIRESYSDGSVQDGLVLGGLVGKNEAGSVKDSYSTAEVSTGSLASAAGGLVGVNSGEVDRSYAAGEVDGDWMDVEFVEADRNAGGLVGGQDLEGVTDRRSVTDSYWDVNTTNRQGSDGGTGLTTREMTGDRARENLEGFDFEDTWRTSTDGYPALRWQSEERQREERLPGHWVVSGVLAVTTLILSRVLKTG